MANLSVGVNVDFTGVTYTPGNGWSPQPAWTFTPPNLEAHQGNNKITWTLTTNNASGQNTVPAGYTAAFASGTSGVAFKATNPVAWTGSTPTMQPDGTITANDNFQNLDENETFNYTTTVVLTPNAGTNGQQGTFTWDPDVENVSGGGGMLTHSVAEPVAGV
jgi:hypothetical protein